MAKSRESANRRQREQAKRAKANAKRERRLSRGDEPTDDDAIEEAPTPPEVVDEEALLAELAQLHAAFDNEEINFDDFETKRTELLSKLQVD